MLALCSMLLGTYYAQNYAGIIGASLGGCQSHLVWRSRPFYALRRDQIQGSGYARLNRTLKLDIWLV